MADLIIGCVKKIGECILTQWIQPPVKSHFDYWWCFDDNINGLKVGIRDLEQRKHYIEQKREEARLLTHILCSGVEEWLNASTEKLEKAQQILLPDHNIPNAWNLISRYSLGKNAKKTAQEIEIFRNEGNFNPIAYPAPPAAMSSPYPRSTMEFESRKSIEKDIVDCLKKSTVGMIVICGMGGVGKTTMAKRIRERVKEEHLFDEVVMVTVSQTIDKPKIQNEIAELLGLKFDVSSVSARADKLHSRLTDTNRKIIILDDVWDNFRSEDLEILGIPIEANFEKCKVILASRFAASCKGIKDKKVFELKILEKDEAWLLFKDKVGDCVEGSRRLNHMAKEVVAECKGLPIALVTVGLALQNITDIGTWDNALSQLRKANPVDFPEVLRDVYNPLKLSYDFLESDTERSLFLLCCLFPEDFNISVEQLTWYSMGLGLFDGSDNIKEARDRTHTLVGKLENRFLLIDEGKKRLQVKMHDVIRDVAIHIGEREKHGFLKSLTSIKNSSDSNCNWMSVDISNEQMEVPLLSRFSKLRLLMLLKLSPNQFSDEFYDISHISFEGMEGLNVLIFEGISILSPISFRSLPPTLGSLENLQTLRLFDCQVENISVIGKLTSLKILICCECPNIKELPVEIGGLKGLRLLELNECRDLQRIPFGIISSLFRLEELKMRSSFSGWETGGERRNASLTELERLRNLTSLEIEISDCTSSAQEILLCKELVRYRISIDHKNYYDFEDSYCEKAMNLKLPGAVGNWIHLLARNAEFLSLKGDGSGNINLAEMGILRSLYISDCSTVKKLVDTSYLNQNDSLCNLKCIRIIKCDKLRNLFSVSAARRCLLQLEVLRIQSCKSMEQVLWNEGTDHNTDGCIEFPKLKELTLWNLPNLTAFCQGLENINIKFPNLTKMSIEGLPLNSLSPLNSETDDHNTRFHLFCNSKDLLQLEILSIGNCASMEQVFWKEDRDDNTDSCIEFPKLKELTLGNLPSFRAFCQGLENITIKFPNLTKMSIKGLPKLNNLSPLNSETDDHNTRFHWFCNSKDLLLLEVLSIENCVSMEQVFWNEVRDDNTDSCIEFPKLKELTLRNLPSFTAFCQRLENITIKFPNLTKMSIKGLPKLNSLSPLNSETDDHNTRFHLFCNSKDLLRLEILRIEDCESMEQLMFWNEIKDNTYGCIEFPKLKELTLWNLPNLTALCQGLENITIKFPNLTQISIKTGFHLFCSSKDVSFCNLKSINIYGCDNLRYLFSVSAARRCLLRLEVLRIDNCVAMEQVFWNEDTDDNTYGCIEFPKLKRLTLENLPNMTAFFTQGFENVIIKFPNLTNMWISKLPKLNSLFPLNSKDLLGLETLCIEDCESMEQLMFWNEIKHNTDGCIEFPKLKELRLWNLPNLTAFCQGLENIIFKFPHLTQMSIKTRFHLFCNPKVHFFLLNSSFSLYQ